MRGKIFLLCFLFFMGCGGGGSSGGSPSAPAAPLGVNVTLGPNNSGQISISWNSVAGATSYNLYMASGAGVNPTSFSTLPNGMKHVGVSNPFTDSSLTSGNFYYFVVTAVNGSGESASSAEVSAQAP